MKFNRVTIAGAVLLFLQIPAFSEIDLTGEWSPRQHHDQLQRGTGPELGDYTGLPINESARRRGDTWTASLNTLLERQCIPYSADYAWLGPAATRIWKEIDHDTQKLVAYHTHTYWQAAERTIYMDGRPHPPEYAAHTWQGFSTGKWEGDTLTITTTHLKQALIQRNGIFRSDKTTLTEHLMRHGNILTVMIIVDDPVYLTEPLVRTADFMMDLHQEIGPYQCEPSEEIPRPKGVVPHNLPGMNPFLTEFSERHHIPQEAARGGAETMYPEYILKMESANKTTSLGSK
jgi:hypothetical protein